MAKCMQCGGATKLKKMKSGGTKGCPPGYKDVNNDCIKTGILDNKSAKIGVATAVAGVMGIGAKAIADKMKAKKAAKKEMAKPAEKKMQMGGSMGIVGMPKYSNDLRTDAGSTLKKGGTVKPKMKMGGSLKPVPTSKVGLSKLPTAVRNKMGFQKKGGLVKAQKGKETGKDPVRNENTKDAAIGSAAYNKQFTSKAARDSANYYRNYAKSLAQYDSKNTNTITKNLDNLQRQYDKGKPGYDAMGYKKDSEGRSSSSKWYGFDPKTKKYTMGPNKGKTHGQVMKATKKK
jgi:hypothetical protein